MVNQETSSPSPSPARFALLRTGCAFVLPWVLATACTHSARRTAAPTPAEVPVGVVRAIGADQRFVLVETPSALAASAVSEGQLLHCRPPDATSRVATADLRVSRERHESLFVANVIAGEAVSGAVVYLTVADALAPSPTPSRGPAVPASPLADLFGPRQP